MKKITAMLGAFMICSSLVSAEQPEKPGTPYVKPPEAQKQPVRSDDYKKAMGRPADYAEKIKNGTFKEFNSKEEFLRFLTVLKEDDKAYNKDTSRTIDAIYNSVSETNPSPFDGFYAFADVTSFICAGEFPIFSSDVRVDDAFTEHTAAGFSVSDTNIITDAENITAFKKQKEKANEEAFKRAQQDISTRSVWGGMR